MYNCKPRAEDLSDRKFGRLQPIRRVENSAKGDTRWLCKCECGNEKVILAKNLKNGATRSCGCLNREIITTHGHTAGHKITPVFFTWSAMIARCYHSYCPGYARYGGRGIKVSDEWLKFENFYRDMGDKPPGKSIDRIDGNGDYCKENCRWATPKEQSNNISTNVWITYNGETHTLKQWSEKINLPYPCLHNRFKLGWTKEEALTIPLRGKRH